MGRIEITKALKYCQDTEGDSCQCCPYFEIPNCQIELLKDAVDIIEKLDKKALEHQAKTKEANAEIGKLKKAIEIHKGIAEDWKYEAKKLKEMVGEDK